MLRRLAHRLCGNPISNEDKERGRIEFVGKACQKNLPIKISGSTTVAYRSMKKAVFKPSIISVESIIRFLVLNSMIVTSSATPGAIDFIQLTSQFNMFYTLLKAPIKNADHFFVENENRISVIILESCCIIFFGGAFVWCLLTYAKNRLKTAFSDEDLAMTNIIFFDDEPPIQNTVFAVDLAVFATAPIPVETSKNADRFESIRYREDKIPETNLCPITRRVFDNPVIIGNPEVTLKHVYEHWAIAKELSIRPRCPVSKAVLLAPPTFIPVVSIKSGIEKTLTRLENQYRREILPKRLALISQKSAHQSKEGVLSPTTTVLTYMM